MCVSSGDVCVCTVHPDTLIHIETPMLLYYMKKKWYPGQVEYSCIKHREIYALLFLTIQL